MTCIYPGSQTTYFYRTLLVFSSMNDVGMCVCCMHTHISTNGICICAVHGGIIKQICLHVWKKESTVADICCIGTYLPFFTFFEDFSYFIKRNVILVRDLEQKKASIGEARRLLALSSTYYFTERNKKKKVCR